MNSLCCVLRFRPTADAAIAMPKARPLLDVFLNDEKTPAGRIVLLEPEPGTPARWTYVLSDGRATGLQSTYSRQDLEGAVREFYFQELAADLRRSA